VKSTVLRGPADAYRFGATVYDLMVDLNGGQNKAVLFGRAGERLW